MPSHLISEIIDAIKKKNTTKVIEYLQQGANPNGYMDRALVRPLHVAVTYAASKIVEVLLSAGADPLAQDCDGETPLHLAITIKNVGKKSNKMQKIVSLLENVTNAQRYLH